MKINLYSIIPAHVRYDRALYDKSILLFGEIAASANAYGICEEQNTYFAMALNADTRTIARCMAQLVDNGHVQRIKEAGRRKLKIVPRTLEIPLGVDIETDDIIPKEDISEFVFQFLSLWEKAVNTTIDKKELYQKLIAQRLSSFTKEELMIALKNRATFVNQSDWHKAEENRQQAVSIDHLLRSDDAVLKWLNSKVKEKEEGKLTAFKRN